MTPPDLPIEPPRHGGDRAAHRRRFPDAPEPLLDLSTGINPRSWPFPSPPPPPDPDALARLPEPDDLAGIERLAATAFGMPPEAAICACPGTGIGLSLLAQTRRAARAAIIGATYAGASEAFAAAGATLLDTPDLADAEATGADAIYLCRPNNPDGRIGPATAILDAAARLARRRAVLIVDEAFADLEPCGRDLAPAAGTPGLMLLRSFGKTHGLPGLRLGFVAGDPASIEPLRAAIGAWPISGHALAIARLALPDQPWRDRTRAALVARAAALDRVLARHALPVQGGTSLFRTVRHPDAARIADRCGRQGILIRSFGPHSHLLRFGIPVDDAALDRLDRALGAKELETDPPRE